jgi:hypothetical protein
MTTNEPAACPFKREGTRELYASVPSSHHATRHRGVRVIITPAAEKYIPLLLIQPDIISFPGAFHLTRTNFLCLFLSHCRHQFQALFIVSLQFSFRSRGLVVKNRPQRSHPFFACAKNFYLNVSVLLKRLSGQSAATIVSSTVFMCG